MKNILRVLILILVVNLVLNTTAISQDVQPVPRLFIAGGALPEHVYNEFFKLTGPDAKLVVVPTASNRDVDSEKIQDVWHARGFKEVSVLHTNDREIATTQNFSESLRTASAIWFSGGSQQKIADAYIGTPVETEIYQLLQRGGIIGGSSAGAAIQTKVMISGGKGDNPKISTGLDLLQGAIIDQHFLKRNRLSRLMSAIRLHPELIGFGIDEGTAIVVYDNEYRIVGESYVLRIELIDGEIKIDAYEDGEIIQLEDR